MCQQREHVDSSGKSVYRLTSNHSYASPASSCRAMSSVDPKHELGETAEPMAQPVLEADGQIEPSNSPAPAAESVPDESTSSADVGSSPRPMAVLLRKVLLVLVVVSAMAAGLLWLVYRSTQKEPTFYGQVAQQPKIQLEQDGDKFETAILELQNSAHQNGPWRSVIKDQEVNGWLEVDCPEKFPELIPRFAKNPRVQILDSQISLAFRYKSRRFNSIVLVVTDVFVVEETDEIAVRIKKARTGIVPLPIAAIADRVTDHLRKSGMSVTWTEMEGDPVALIRVPDELLTFDGQTIRIEAIDCQEHQIELIGRSISQPAMNPSGNQKD